MKKIIFWFLALISWMGGMECLAQTVSGKIAGYDYVDLGLPSGRKWATYNVGATKATEYGNYYAWGDTAIQEVYDEEHYKWWAGRYNRITKYCTSSSYGSVDNKKVLEAEDDVVTVLMGKEWRMPTKKGREELTAGCTWRAVAKYGTSRLKTMC